MYSIETVNYLLAAGTLGMQVVTVALLGVFILRKRVPAFADIASAIGSWGLWIVALFSFVGSLLTLYYSEVLGVPPCDLCWWQRIFLYPQVVLFGMALWKRDTYVADYSIVLSIIGGGFALYHHALQMFPGSLPCPATGVSCATRILFEFGYITYPLMAVSLFAFLIVVMLFVRANRSS